MISIIICSINPSFLLQVKSNISSTIGVEYELLVWDNTFEKKGICTVYNLMAEKAKYEYLAFLHEDILFKTDNWGSKLARFFIDNPAFGIVGLGGSKYKSRYYSGWYTGIPEADCVNIIHRYLVRDEHQFIQPSNSKRNEEVVCIDGVFMACRKSVWEQVRFDEKRVTGFHFYDIDFSLRASQAYKIAVTFEILLIHVTKGGDYGNNWINEALSYYSNSGVELPINKLTNLPSNAERIVAKSWLEFLKKYKISWRNKGRWIITQRLYLQPLLFFSILKFLVYKPLGLSKILQKKSAK